MLTLCCIITTNIAISQNIPNAGFENWTTSGFPAVENPNQWGTLNGSTAIISVFTVTKTSGADAYSGNHAIRLISRFISFANATAPGMATTGTINTNTQAVEGGFVYTQRPNALTGWYKANPQQGDKGSVEIKLWRRVGGVEEVIADSKLDFTTTVSTFTKFVLPINYLSSATPDSARIILFSSDGANAVQNSELIIDELSFLFCPTANVTTTDETSVGANDGTATVNVTGGATPYSYAWATSATTQSISGLSPGNYCVTVTDDNGCNVEACGIVSSPSCAGFSVTSSATNETVAGNNDGSITTSTNGGNAPFTYQWSTGATTDELTNLSPGNYCFTVGDATNCLVSDCITILAGEQPVSVKENEKINFSIYPNPVINELTVINYSNENCNIYVYDLNGRILIESVINTQYNYISTQTLTKGVYIYQIINNTNGNTVNGKFVK